MKISVGRKILAVAAFWALAIFGGAVVVLWNALAPRFAQFYPGDLGYLILMIVATPIGVHLADAAMDSITREACPALRLVNCVVAATLFLAVTTLNVLYISGVSAGDVISMLLAVGVAVYSAHDALMAIYKNKDKEYDQMRKQLEEAKPVMEMFNQFASQAGMTVPEYVDYIREQVAAAESKSE